MASNYVEYYIQLIDFRLGTPINDDTGVYNVLTASDPTEITIYSDDKGTSGANPGTMTDGIIRFFTDSGTTSVDLSILTASGHAVFVEGLTISQHHVMVNVEQISQTLIVPYSCNTACNTLIDTGFDLPVGAKVREVYLHATSTATVGSLDVGNSTDTDGYLDLALASTTGWKIYDTPIWTTATGDSSDVISGTQVRGALLVDFASGSTTNIAGSGWWATKVYTVANDASGPSLVYFLTSTNSGGTGEGYVYVIYDRCPTQGN